MKNLLRKLSSVILVLLLGVLSTLGQTANQKKQTDNTVFDLNKDIHLKNESNIIAVLIPVNEQNIQLQINITTMVLGGELTIEIFDPAGEKHGNYSVGSKNSIKVESKTYNQTNTETVTGQISKSIKYPVNGNWKINIIPKTVTGEIYIKTKQTSID